MGEKPWGATSAQNGFWTSRPQKAYAAHGGSEAICDTPAAPTASAELLAAALGGWLMQAAACARIDGLDHTADVLRELRTEVLPELLADVQAAAAAHTEEGAA